MTASDNVTDGDNDPLDFRSTIGSRDSGTVIEEAPVGRTHDNAVGVLHDVSVLKRQRKRVASKQRALLKKMKQLERRSVDVNEVGVVRGWLGGAGWLDGWCGVVVVATCMLHVLCSHPLQRVSEVVQDPRQKETVELLHRINELDIQCIYCL